MNTRDALDELVQLGGEWDLLSGTGEVVCRHPDHRERVRLSHWKRRKSAPRRLVRMLKHLRKKAETNG